MSAVVQPLSPRAANALLHFTVFIWGFTAILGRSISIGALPLVWYRIGLVVLIMGAVIVVRGVGFSAPPRRIAQWAGTGVLVALHWLGFYGCIKHSGIAVAVLCLSTLTFFTALIEPLVFKRRVAVLELVLGAAVVAGVALILKLETHTDALGLALGLGSSLFSAGFGTLNGKLALGQPSERVTFYELLSAVCVVTLFFALRPDDFIVPTALTARDGGLLLLLAVVCTVLPWQWSLRILRTLSPYTIALAVSLEPVYSMALAYGLFPDSEQLTWRFYAGAAVLVLLVGMNSWLKRPRAVAM